MLILPKSSDKSVFKTDLRKNSSSGQALLLVLLAFSVVLTVALSVSSKTVTEITTTTYEEDALRAFNVAEIGVEQALLTEAGSGGSVTVESGLSYESEITETPEGSSFNYPVPLEAGDTATFWFAAHDLSTGLIDCIGSDCLLSGLISGLCWGEIGGTAYTSSNPDGAPAIEVSIFYDDYPSLAESVSAGDFSHVGVSRATYDRFGSQRGNNFEVTGSSIRYDPAGTCTLDGKNYAFSTRYSQQLTVSPYNVPCNPWSREGCLLMARVRMLYNDSPQSVGIRVQAPPDNSLPPQGIQIDSVGEAGESTRRLSVMQSYPEPYTALEAAVFSKEGLTK